MKSNNFITRFTNNGALDWSTFVGGDHKEGNGTVGSGNPDITINNNNEVFMHGTTYSPASLNNSIEIPLQNNNSFYYQDYNWDIYLNNFDVSDSYTIGFDDQNFIIYGSYFGGYTDLSNDPSITNGEFGIAVATSSNLSEGDLFVTGATHSCSDNPGMPGQFPLNKPYSQSFFQPDQGEITPYEKDAYIAQIRLAVTNIENKKNRGYNNLNVYPNPTEDYIVISIPDCFGSQNTFEIFNIIGDKVKTIHIKDKKSARISVSDLADGIYILKCKTSNGIYKKKIIRN